MESTAVAGVADWAGGLDLLGVVGCGIWVYDGDEILYANRALAELTGFELEELLQPGFFERLIHPDDHEMIVSRGRARVRGEPVPERYEVRIIDKSDAVKTLALHARRVAHGEGTVSVVSAVDVTPLRDAEKTIQEGTSRVLNLLHALPAHIIATNPRGKPTFVNRHWLEFTGQSVEEAMESGTAPVIHPDDLARTTDAWLAALRSECGYDIDYRIRDSTGVYRWQNFRIRPVHDPDGPLLGWISASVDVHETKELQQALELANDSLTEAIRAKDEVLGLVSHELRSPLTTLAGNGRLLSRLLADPQSECFQVAAEIERDTRRLAAVVENMLVLSRPTSRDDLQLEPARLNHLAQACVEDFLSRTPGRNVVLTIAPDLPVAEANATYYEQILNNLLTNAHKYSPAASPIEVQLNERVGSIETSVRDLCEGIPESEVLRIFDPFYRSQGHSHIGGIGLGLTVCQRLTELQGGTLTFRNLPHGGCEFSFTTPIAELGTDP